MSFQVQQIGKKESKKKCTCQALSLVWSETQSDKVWHDGQVVVESTALLEG
jgi:hypothetical protein